MKTSTKDQINVDEIKSMGGESTQLKVDMTDNRADLDPSTWDPALDAVIAAPKHHKVLYMSRKLLMSHTKTAKAR